jgi:hypothetical protein
MASARKKTTGNTPKITPTERSKRFVEMAKKASGATDPKIFDKVFDKIVGRKK